MCKLQLRAKGDLCGGRYIHLHALLIANVCRLQRVFGVHHHLHHACAFRQLSVDRNRRLLDAFDYRNGLESCLSQAYQWTDAIRRLRQQAKALVYIYSARL